MKVSNKNKGIKGNILLVANYPSDVGFAWWLMEGFWSTISEYFSANNYKAILIYPEINSIPDIIANSDLIIEKCNFSDTSKNGKNNLKKIIVNHNIKYIYLTDKKFFDLYYLQLRLYGVKKIIDHYHWAEQQPHPKYKQLILYLIQRIGILSCDHYIGVSQYVTDRFVDHDHIPASRCSCVRNGIEPITDHENNKFYAHRKFDIPHDAIIVVTTGRAAYYKGIDVFIEAANILINHDNQENLYFLHLGDGPDLIAFHKMVENFNLAPKVILAGKRDDVRKILPSCHIGIQLSQGEAFSLAVLEYMSAGLATLVPNRCGNIEAVKDKETGIHYATITPEEVARLIKKLLQDKELRVKLGSAAKKSIIEEFNILQTNRALSSTIAKVLEK